MSTIKFPPFAVPRFFIKSPILHFPWGCVSALALAIAMGFSTHSGAESRVGKAPLVTPVEVEQDLQTKLRLQEKIKHELEENRRKVLEESRRKSEKDEREVPVLSPLEKRPGE